jgi:hypothetical protein
MGLWRKGRELKGGELGIDNWGWGRGNFLRRAEEGNYR